VAVVVVVVEVDWWGGTMSSALVELVAGTVGEFALFNVCRHGLEEKRKEEES